MHYALLGDIHSSKEDLERVLADISEKCPTAVRVGTGDLFECIISKKDITNQKYTKLKDVMIIPEGFTELLTFLSVSGNQEDRILMITETNNALREKLAGMPESINIATAKIIHGHQWKWGGDPWALIHPVVNESPVFYGHSHASKLSRNDVGETIEFGIPYDISGDNVLVNVGAVVIEREWLLYDSFENTVTFMKA